jgi:Ca2+-binding EF-hand superfamily protein
MFVSTCASAALMACRAVRVRSLAIAISATVFSLAHAGQTSDSLPTGGHAGNAFIGAWDDDGDGKVSRTEYETARTSRFATTDANRNDALSVDEYVDEYAVRLDRDIADEREASLKQTNTRFEALDKDDDKFVSRAEYDASGERGFVHLDRDQDGKVTQQDAAPAKGQTQPGRQRSLIAMPTTHTLAGMLEIYDDDGDDVLSKEQYDRQRASAFAATDTNQDGKLDANEYTSEFAARLTARIAERREAQLKQAKVRFKAIDDNENGSISRDEYVAMSARMFERADTNKDGRVAQDDPPPVRQPRTDERAVTSQVQTQ